MARVIKAGAGAARPARPATRVLAQADVKKVIEKELFLAKQEAGELLKRADVERREILANGKRQAALAHEEAMTRGASEAFALAAEEALVAFRKRADRYTEAADDIRTLAVEIAKKLLGTDPDLSAKDVERILQSGLTQLRAKRKVRVQVAAGRRNDLGFERPNLMKAVDVSPDLLVEDADDVRAGFARVVTEVGGSLCAEDSALDAVALAVNIKETPRLHTSGGVGATHVGPMSTSSEEPRAQSRPLQRQLPDTGEELPDLSEEVGEQSRALQRQLPDTGEELPELDVDSFSGSISELPALEDDDDEATRVLPAPKSASVAPTRVLPAAKRDQLLGQAKHTATRDDDDDLDLFTDDRPQR